jgi:hypothetical protein
MLGDNTGGGAVMLQPVGFECAGVCVLTELPSLDIYNSQYIHLIPTRPKFNLRQTFRQVTTVQVGSVFSSHSDKILLATPSYQLFPRAETIYLIPDYVVSHVNYILLLLLLLSSSSHCFTLCMVSSPIFCHGSTVLVGLGLLMVEVSSSYLDSVGLLRTSDRPIGKTST